MLGTYTLDSLLCYWSESRKDGLAKQGELTHLGFFGQMPGGITLPRPLNI